MIRQNERRLILVGIDGSDAAALALNWAIELAHDVGGELAVVHALDTELIAYLTQHLKGRFDLNDWEREQRGAFEDEWTAPLTRSGVPSRTLIMQGRPTTVLQEAAKGLNADLIVVGRHGHRMVTRMLLGSVADALVHHSPVPVVVYPPPEVSDLDMDEGPHLEVSG